MDIRDLKLFRHLCTTLHFGRTSQACNITPSGLTRTIQRLEGELGRQLFSRDRRAIALTASGRIFSDYADDVLQRWNTLQAELNRDDVLHGSLTLYCSVTAILSILPAILERFRKLHPQVHIHLQTGDAAMAIARVAGGEADIGVAALPDELPRHLRFIKIIETPLLFIAPLSNEQAVVRGDDGGVDWQKTPLIVAERGLSRSRLEEWFRRQAQVPTVYSQVAGNEAIITLVGMGYGVGVVPELVLVKSPMKDKVRILRGAPLLQPFSVGVCTSLKNMQNPLIRAFWQIVQDGQEHQHDHDPSYQ